MTLVYRPDDPRANQNGMVDKAVAGPKSSELKPNLGVISDTMDHCRHMATGKVYDSKSKFRADTRATGCVEVGTDPAARKTTNYKPPDLVPYAQKAIDVVSSGYKPDPRRFAYPIKI